MSKNPFLRDNNNTNNFQINNDYDDSQDQFDTEPNLDFDAVVEKNPFGSIKKKVPTKDTNPFMDHSSSVNEKAAEFQESDFVQQEDQNQYEEQEDENQIRAKEEPSSAENNLKPSQGGSFKQPFIPKKNLTPKPKNIPTAKRVNPTYNKANVDIKNVQKSPFAEDHSTNSIQQKFNLPKEEEIQNDPLKRTSKNFIVLQNNSNGFCTIKVSRTSIRQVPISQTYLKKEQNMLAKFPGPLRISKKNSTAKDQIGDLINYLNVQYSSDKNPIVVKICSNLLREYGMIGSCNIFSKENAEVFQSLQEQLEYLISQTDLSIFGEEFANYYHYYSEYLDNTENIEFVDEQWEDILFKSLFLRNSSFSIDSKNIDFLLNYIKSRFVAGDPLFTISMVKMGFFHEIFESDFFKENPIEQTWPLLILPCLKNHQLLPKSCIKEYFNSLALQIMHDKNEKLMEYILLIIAALSGEFDNDVFQLLPKFSSHQTFLTFLETYYYVQRRNYPEFDSKQNLVRHIIPQMLNYAFYLVNLGMWENAQLYLDHILSLRNSFGYINNNMKFIVNIRKLRELVVNYFTIQEEAKRGKANDASHYNRQDGISNSGKKDINQFASQAFETIQSKGKGFFKSLGGAFSNLVNTNPSEAGGSQYEQSNTNKSKDNDEMYYDKVRKQWVIRGQLPPDESEDTNSKQNPTNSSQNTDTRNQSDDLGPPPMVQQHKSDNAASLSTFKSPYEDLDDTNVVEGGPPTLKSAQSNPFSKANTDKKSTSSNTTKKNLMQNRYVSHFKK